MLMKMQEIVITDFFAINISMAIRMGCLLFNFFATHQAYASSSDIGWRFVDVFPVSVNAGQKT